MLRMRAASIRRRRRLSVVAMLATFAPLLVAASSVQGDRTSFACLVSYVRGENDVGAWGASSAQRK